MFALKKILKGKRNSNLCGYKHYITSTTLRISMQKEIEQVLQKTIKVEHSKSLKGVKLPKINFEEVVTFHNREQDHFTDITKKSKPKN